MATNIAVAQRDLPFLKYRVDEVVRPDVAGSLSIEGMLGALGLDFTVDKRKLYTHDAKGHRITVPDMYANVRTDTEEPLGIVGKNYVIHQHAESLAFGNSLLDSGEALGESGWSLRNGRNVGVTLRIPSADISVPGDGGGFLQMYLMLQNSHDGNSSLSGHIGPVRLACTNMIPLFERSAVSSFRIKHTSGLKGKLANVKNTLGIVHRYKTAMEEHVDRLLNVTLVESQVDAILRDAFPLREDVSDRQRANSAQAAVMENWRTSPTIDEIRGTGWGVVNAANEYFEHLQNVRTTTYDRDSVRGISILQGTAYQATNRVAELVLAR